MPLDAPAPSHAVALALALAFVGCVTPPGDSLLLASTTSARDTGLLDALEDAFERDAGVDLRYVAVGSGQAMALARRGDADVVLAHSPAEEEAFVRGGHGLWRRLVMHNEFLLVGPVADPAGAAGENVTRALSAVAEARATFASRSDESGTHEKERELWARAGLDPRAFERSWYKETGAGMAATLRFADEAGAYTLTDDGTWAKLRAAGELTHLRVIVRGDPPLRNPYHVIPVSNETHPHARTGLAIEFADWLTGPRGQAVVANHAVGGERLFTPAGG